MKASNNPFPSVLLDHTSNTAIATPDAFESRFFADADGSLAIKDSTGSVTGVGSNFATSAIAIHVAESDPHSGYVLESVVDASYDLIVGDGANSVTRLGIGASNTLLGSSNSLAYVPVGTKTFAPDSLYASAAPTTADDFSAGWRRGSVWVYNDTTYILVDENAGTWQTVGSAGASALDDLTDVDTDKSKTPADGDVLTFDGTDWNAEAAAASGSSTPNPWPIPRYALWAHRGDIGSTDSYPEHTLEAALQAILKGCDGVELDVRLSSEGTFYQMHDSTVDRTTDGTGAVSSKTDAQMDALAIDGGYGYDAGRHGTSLTVPTLAACLDALEPYDCTIKIQLNDSSTANANQLADQVVAAGLGDRCILEVDTVAEATEIKSVDSTLTTMVNVTASGATGSADVDWLSVVDSSVTNLAYSTAKAPQSIGAYVSISDYGSSEATTFQNMWDYGAAAFQTNNVDAALALRKTLLYSSSGTPAGGTEYDYTESTSGVNVTATSEASATTVITAGAIAFDGTTPVMIEFFSPHVRPDTGGGKNISLFLFDGSTSIGKVHFSARLDAASEGQSCHIVQRITPSAATHTYSIRGIVSAGTGGVSAGAGGAGNDRPMFIRITAA